MAIIAQQRCRLRRHLVIQREHHCLFDALPLSAITLLGLVGASFRRSGNVTGYRVDPCLNVYRPARRSIRNHGVLGALPWVNLRLWILYRSDRLWGDGHDPIPPAVLRLDIRRELVGGHVQSDRRVEDGLGPVALYDRGHLRIPRDGRDVTGLAGNAVGMLVQGGGAGALVGRCGVAVGAGDLHIQELLSLEICPTGHLVLAGRVAAGAMDPFGQVDIGIHGRGHSVLVVGTATRAGMTPQAHLARWFLDALSRSENIDTRNRGQSKLVTILYDRPPVVRRMAEQAVDIVIVRLGKLADGVRFLAESWVALNATTWLRRFRGILGLEDPNPVMSDNRIGGSSVAHHHASHLTFRPIFKILRLCLLLVMQADRYLLGRFGMADQASPRAFVVTDALDVAGLSKRKGIISDHTNKEQECR